MPSWSGPPGQVHPRWQEDVDDARRTLAEEQDPALRGFWEYCIAVAEERLEIERGRIEERE
jgi:hypothetical protein